ncbi:MAG: hypothetical protein ACTSPO_15935 [Candidatus Heimdallarchaeaceae archaeon]
MVDRNDKAVKIAGIKQEVEKNIDKIAKEVWELRAYKQQEEAKIAQVNAKHGKDGILVKYKGKIRRLIDIEHQLKTGKDDRRGLWEPINPQCHDYIVKTVNMLISEAEYLKHQLKMDNDILKADMGFTQKELNKAKEDAKNGVGGYKYFK